MSVEQMYQEIILDHYKHPHHRGLREPFAAEVLHVNPTCGDEVTLRVALSPDGETVTAPQAGNVVFAGTLTLTGGTVVIDHGCGVKSYLYGLETVGVERGQSVSAGDPLGTAGTAHNLIYELRIGSKSTDPQTALDGNSGLQFREAE